MPTDTKAAALALVISAAFLAACNEREPAENADNDALTTTTTDENPAPGNQMADAEAPEPSPPPPHAGDDAAMRRTTVPTDRAAAPEGPSATTPREVAQRREQRETLDLTPRQPALPRTPGEGAPGQPPDQPAVAPGGPARPADVDSRGAGRATLELTPVNPPPTSPSLDQPVPGEHPRAVQPVPTANPQTLEGRPAPNRAAGTESLSTSRGDTSGLARPLTRADQTDRSVQPLAPVNPGPMREPTRDAVQPLRAPDAAVDRRPLSAPTRGESARPLSPVPPAPGARGAQPRSATSDDELQTLSSGSPGPASDRFRPIPPVDTDSQRTLALAPTDDQSAINNSCASNNRSGQSMRAGQSWQGAASQPAEPDDSLNGVWLSEPRPLPLGGEVRDRVVVIARPDGRQTLVWTSIPGRGAIGGEVLFGEYTVQPDRSTLSPSGVGGQARYHLDDQGRLVIEEDGEPTAVFDRVGPPQDRGRRAPSGSRDNNNARSTTNEPRSADRTPGNPPPSQNSDPRRGDD